MLARRGGKEGVLFYGSGSDRAMQTLKIFDSFFYIVQHG